MNSYGRGKPPPPSVSPAYMAKVLGIKSVKSKIPSPSQPNKKRKANSITPKHNDVASPEPGSASKKARKEGNEQEEKRLRRFRQKPPHSYLERLVRVRTQRMFLIERHRTLAPEGTHEEEVFDIAGSTGNVYQVKISKIPTCNCPDSMKGNHCKHIVYVMVNILKAREDLAYQLALLSTELSEIFASAPVTQAPGESSSSLSTDTGGNRKPVEGDCPVCVMEFEEGEDIVWCKAACGQNIHRTCFEQWQRSKPGAVKCVYCRSVWKGEEKDVKKISKDGRLNAEGYVNVAGELGISQQRDTSSYHSYWVARQGYNF